MVPDVVIFPILCPLFSVNQRFPSGPAAMAKGELEGVGIGNSEKAPATVRRPTLFALLSMNQIAPSGPAAIPTG
jgi:hypothetical protein